MKPYGRTSTEYESCSNLSKAVCTRSLETRRTRELIAEYDYNDNDYVATDCDIYCLACQGPCDGLGLFTT